MTDTDPQEHASGAGPADAPRPLAPLPGAAAPDAEGTADAAGPALAPVEPGEVHAVPVEAEPVATRPAGRLARAGGYLLAAVAGGAIVAVALAAAGMLGGGSSPASGTTDASRPGASTGASSGTAPGGSATPGGSGAGSGAGSAAAAEGAPVLGDPAAPVLVEVWADYQCPFCGVVTHAIEPALVRDFVETGKIRFVFRDFAFLGDESVEAAAAARCAGEQGGYWLYHDLLFASQQGENQGAFAPKNLAQLAAFADLDTQAFATCMDARKAHGAALAQTEEGRAIGISSTPTFHVVGPRGATLLKGVTQLSKIEEAIQQTIDGTVPSPTPEPAASGPAAPATSDAPAASPSATEPSAAP